MSDFIHQHADWAHFTWSNDVNRMLGLVHLEQGRLLGKMEGLGFPLLREAVLQTLTDDVVKSSEIEGERLDTQQVRSSIARRIGMNVGALAPRDQIVEGVVEMMLDATRHYEQELTTKRLFDWHAALFPTGRAGMRAIRVAGWRDDAAGPMQVVSGQGKQRRVHFEAPSAEKVEAEMERFLDWFNSDNEPDWVLKAAIAHLWFVTIHPFDDGNGRIARAICDLSLARSEQSAQRFYSVSAQIRLERNAYYEILEQTQRGTSDITDWLVWFLGCLDRAILTAHASVGTVLAKKFFWDSVRDIPLNDRQRSMVNRLLTNFEGKLTTQKWAKLTKASHDTALRDIRDLVDRGILIQNGERGRSTSYRLVDTTKERKE